MSNHQDATTSCRHLGRQIRGIREGRGLSDRDLAVEAGMLTTTVVAIEDGWDSIPIGTIARVANALGCELSISPRGATVTPIGDRLRALNEPAEGDRVEFQYNDGTLTRTGVVVGIRPLRVRADDTGNITTSPIRCRRLVNEPGPLSWPTDGGA